MANEHIPLNQALGNFYPGKPMPKYGGGKAIEFSDMTNLYEVFFKDFENVITPSNYYKSINPISISIGDSIKEALRVSVKKPSTAQRWDVPTEFVDDIDDIPGVVSVSLNINPVDWIKNPKKESQSLFNSIIKGTFGYDPKSRRWNFSDIDSSIEKDYIWKPLLNGERLAGKKNISFIDKYLASGVEKKISFIGQNPKSVSLGFTSSEADGIIDFTKSSSFYQMGSGLINQPSNSVDSFRNIYEKFHPMLKAESEREGASTKMSLSHLAVLNSSITKNRDVSYIVGGDLEKLLNTRILDRAKNVSRLIDPFGNDAISTTTKTVIDLRKKIDDLGKEKISINAKLSSLSPTDPHYAERKKELQDRLNNIPDLSRSYAKAYNTSLLNLNHIYIEAKKEIDAMGLSRTDPNNKAILDFYDEIDKATKSKTNLIAGISSGSLPVSVVNLTNFAFDKAKDNSDYEISFRSQINCLQSLNSFEENLSKFINSRIKDDGSGYAGASQIKFGFETDKYTHKKAGPAEKLKATTELVKKIESSINEQLDNITKTRDTLKGSPKDLLEFNKIYSKIEKQLLEMRTRVVTISNPNELLPFLKKQSSIFSTDTAGGGLIDAATRRSMERIYLTDTPLSKNLESDLGPDFVKTKVFYLVARSSYEKEVAKDWVNMFDTGPISLLETPIKKFIKERTGLVNIDGGIKSILQENILKPLCYFGLLHTDENHKELIKEKGVRGFLYRRVGINFANFFGVNNFKVNVGKIKISLTGAVSLKGAEILGGLSKAKVLDLASLTAYFNAKSFNDLENVLKGIQFPTDKIEELQKDFKAVLLFKEWVEKDKKGIKAAKLLGISKDKNGNYILNDYFKEFLEKISIRKANPTLTAPTEKYIGSLTKLSQFLSEIQNRYIKIIQNVRRPFVYLKFIVTESIANLLILPLQSAVGPLAEFFRIFIKAVVQKIVDIASKVLMAIIKFDLDELVETFEKLISTSFKWIFAIIFTIVFLVTFIFDGLGSLLGGVSPVDNSQSTAIDVVQINDLINNSEEESEVDPQLVCNEFNVFPRDPDVDVNSFLGSLQIATNTIAGYYRNNYKFGEALDIYGPFCDNETRSSPLPFVSNFLSTYNDLAPESYKCVWDDAPRSAKEGDVEKYQGEGNCPGYTQRRRSTDWAYYRGGMDSCENNLLSDEIVNGLTPEQIVDYAISKVDYLGYKLTNVPKEKVFAVVNKAKEQGVNPYVMISIWGTESYFGQYKPECNVF